MLQVQNKNQKYHQVLMHLDWLAFAQEYGLDVNYGCLIPQTYKVQTFNFETLRQANLRIESSKTDEEVFDVIENFPDLQLKEVSNQRDLIILHDYLITILCPFLTRKRMLHIPQETIILPRNMARPLYLSSITLGFKYGMNTSSFYNWKPLNDNYLKENVSFGMQDLELCIYLTQNHYQEHLFFGGLIVGSFYIAKMIKIVLQVNQIIQNTPFDFETVIGKLQLCAQYWQKIAKENRKVADQFDPYYFNIVLRPQVRGFTNLIFEGAGENGQNLVLSSHGGTAGNDPSFQMFESSFGIVSSGKYQKMQKELRTGMIKRHIKCIEYLQENSWIRKYCMECDDHVKQAYNKVIKAYGKFLRIHSEFMAKFILWPAKEFNPELKEGEQKGTAGTVIMEIIKRYENVESQCI